MSDGLIVAWFERAKMYAEGNKLRAEGDKLYAEGNKLHAEGDELRAEGSTLRAEGNKLYAEGSTLRAEGNKLKAEGNKLRAEGNLRFISAVIAAYGPKEPVEWTRSGCTLRGREFKNDEPI